MVEWWAAAAGGLGAWSPAGDWSRGLVEIGSRSQPASQVTN